MIEKAKAKYEDLALKAGVAITLPLITMGGANAAMDVAGVVDKIGEVEDPVNKIASATLGVVVLMYGWRKAKSAIR